MFGKIITAASILLATTASSSERSVATVMDYFQKIDTAEAGFSQISEDGTVHTGKLFIDRPGKMRFDYASQEALVLASAGAIAIFDGFDGKSVTQYPLSNTPLELLLGNISKNSAQRFIKNFSEDNQSIEVLLRDDARPEVGSIQLNFSKNPITLRKWVSLSESGEETTVVLQDLVLGKDYAFSSFSIDAEKSRRGINQSD